MCISYDRPGAPRNCTTQPPSAPPLGMLISFACKCAKYTSNMFVALNYLRTPSLVIIYLRILLCALHRGNSMAYFTIGLRNMQLDSELVFQF